MRARLEPTAQWLAGVHQADGHVLDSGQSFDEVELLEDEADVTVAQRRQVGVAEACDVVAGDVDRARRRQVERADEVEQRALPGSRRSDDGDEVALAHARD